MWGGGSAVEEVRRIAVVTHFLGGGFAGFLFQSRSLRSNMASTAISSIMSQLGSSRLTPT